MTVHDARVVDLADVLVGISPLVPGTRLDPQQTLDEPRALAEQGDTEEQFNLGVTYANGHGVPQDHAEAARWYRLAADQRA